MVVIDPKFKNVGRKRGIEIWRIKNFDLEVVPKEQFGNFYSGDSYIILNTKNNDNWDVHFWLGRDTSQDEAGTAAIKTVELDDSLGGLPVQYREVQDHESAVFLSYFKDGIKYMQGGHSSGFNHVVDPYSNYKPKLFQCKGKRNVRCTQVDCKLDSLNLGDVFLLDLGLNIYVWMPPEAGRLERVKGVNQAKSIRDQERAGRPKIHVLDQDWKENATFWKHFGGAQNASRVKSAKAGGVDENYWREKGTAVTLWKVSDASGTLKVSRVAQGSLNIKDLNTNDAFILDADQGGVFVWIGKECNKEERSKAQQWGQEYLKQHKRNKYTQVIRVLEGAEPQIFTQWFANWSDTKKAQDYKPKLYNVSNETGKLVIDEVANFTQEDLDTDDVMILDALNTIYVWIGDGANKQEREAASQTAKKYLETDKVPRHKTAQIDILNQGKENPGFKKLFASWDDKIWAKKEKDYKNLRELLFQSSGPQKVMSFAH
ncbi:unnamed protein product [Bursaphelenchus okinawaensis]|uniref:Gelsolin-like domain-containing protein n=1 Tax=Bursaphelenchus okinawaensis TaxID=465554 RepID=A0A811JS15_9BILA|nr:unnamed protein product [Bursaphelenchus okinawaensis]CAG9080476.1 unnamed protein product [Bursaphelenchus okinawaensis]